MREKLVELVGNVRRKITAWHTAEDIADMLIANGVTIPVRCEDCKAKHEYSPTRWFCGLTGMPIDEDAFCSYGERKDND